MAEIGMSMELPELLQRMVAHTPELARAYLVGGCVRDLLLGRKPKDFDVATAAHPRQIKRLFRNGRIIGRRFRLVHVVYGPHVVETATFRARHEWSTVQTDSAIQRMFSWSKHTPFIWPVVPEV